MKSRWSKTALVAGLLAALPSMLHAQTPVYQMIEPYTALGIEDGREHSVSLDEVATVDPFTGMLQVRHTDLEFPGVGPTIRVTRSFHSHPVRAAGGGAPVLRAPNLMAAGWDFHFGYVRFGDAAGGPTVNCDVFTPTPTANRVPRIVFPDGRDMPLFQPTMASGNPHHFVGSNGWVADCLTGAQSGFRVIDPAGTIYLFTRWSVLSTDAASQTFGYQLDEVRDVHGNALTFVYQAHPGLDEIQSISAADGRRVTFTYEPYLGGRRLREVQAFYNSTLRESWLYSYDPVPGVPGYSYLSSVDGPEGLSWSYTYETTMPGLHDIKTITSPFGATKSFEYATRSVPNTSGLGTTVAVHRATWSGPRMPSAEWTYTYAPSATAGDLLDITTITTPDTVEIWTFCGERAIADPSQDPLSCSTRIGSLEHKEIYARTAQGGQGSLLQSETFTWNQPVISEQSFPFRHMPFFVQVPHAILQGRHTITRDGEHFTTHYADYDPMVLQPTLISDFRDLDLTVARQRQTQLWIEPTNWLVRTSSVVLNDYTVNDPLNGPHIVGSNGVVRHFNPDGTPSSQTVKGVTDTYTYRSDGLPETYTTYGTGGHFEARDYELGVITELYSTGRDATLTRSLNTEGYINTETDWEGHTTRLHYDGLGRVRRIETPRTTDEDIVVTRSFATQEATITRGGYIQHTRFDGLGRPYEVITGDVLVRTERDAKGRIIFESDPVSASATLPAQCVNPTALSPCGSVAPSCPGTCTTYDALGRITQQIYTVDNSSTQFAYPTALQTEITNAKGQVTTITHERFGNPDEHRPIRIEQEEGVSTTITYYINGHPKTITQDGDGTLEGPPRTFLLDEDHRLIGELNPESHWRRYTYDLNGRLASSHFPDGTTAGHNRLYYEYDPGDRLINYGPFSPTDKVMLTYDNNNRVRTNSYKQATWTYGYDENGNRTSESLEMNGRTFSFGRTYDELDYLRQLVYPSTRTVDYAPDALGRPTQASPHITSISYHPNSMLNRLDYANGHFITYTPDSNKPALPGRIAGGPINFDYDYDALGNVESITDMATSGNNVALGYDALNRLTSATGRWGSASYEYDLKNGLHQMTLNGLATNYTYGYQQASTPNTYAPHHLQGTTGRVGTRFAHDRRGNATLVEEMQDPSSVTPTERRVDQFEYDWRDRPTQHRREQIGLTEFRRAIVETVEYEKTTTYRYDGNGQRVSKGSDHFFIYSGDQLIYEEDHQEKTAREYIHVGALSVAEVVEDCAGESGTQPWCMSTDQPPKVAILSPSPDARPDHRASVVFEAVAFDAESGDLSEQIRWYEALSTVGDFGSPPPDVFLGQGRTFDIGALGIGYHRIEARLMYGAGQEMIETVQFEVVAGPNTAPIAVGTPGPISTAVGTPLAVDMTSWFTDDDGDTLTYSISNLPPWLSIVGPQLIGTPSTSDSGALIQVNAFDGLESSLPLSVEVRIDAPPIVWTGTPLGDTFYSGPGNDTLEGLDGTDHLYGEGGNDTIFGGHGDFDHVWGNAGDDMLDGGPGDFDQLYGGDGNDQLEAGPGDFDFMDGGEGNDVFVYRQGDGSDTLRDFGGDDELHFPDLLPDDMSFQYDGSPPSPEANTNIIHVVDLTGQPMLQIGDTSAIPTTIETVRFMDGSTWTIESLVALLQPTDGHDMLFGTSADDTIAGEEGDDFLVGHEGSDTLRGGPGDDIMVGGNSSTSADDTFIFSLPIGDDTVYDFRGTQDTFMFEDVPSTDVGFEANSRDLILVGTNWRITFYGHWVQGTSDYKLERLTFSDGVVWDQATLEANYQQAVGGTP